MFRVRALRPIFAGTVLHGVLENFSDSLSSRVAKQIAASKIPSADKTTVDLSLS